MNDEQAGSERRRIEALENIVRSLVPEVQRLRAEVSKLRGEPVPGRAPEPVPELVSEPMPNPVARPMPEPVPVLAPARPAPRPSRPVSTDGLEQLIGRYGTLVVATLALLLGLGAFLQWAISRGMLGPEIRLAMGLVAAVALAAVGLRIRSRGSARYGNALLAIALAVVHLDAWAAGPELGLVAPMLALTGAALASLALAALAIRDGEEFLFCLGIGGALLAPFVTMVGEGGPGQLLLFGGVVLAAAIVALRHAEWGVAPRLVPLFAAWYMVAAADSRGPEMSPASAFWPSSFALLLALVALALGARGIRRPIVRNLLLLLVIAIPVGGNAANAAPWSAIAYALFGTLTVHAMRRRSAATDDGGPDSWYEVVGLPLLFLGAAVVVEDRYKVPAGAMVAAGWAAVTGVLLFLDGHSHRARHLSVILSAAFVASIGLLHDNEVARIAAFATVAVLGVFTLDRIRGRSLLLPVGLALAAGLLRVLILYDRRAAWEYTPFVNAASLTAATLVAAALMLSWVAPRALTQPDARRGPWDGDLTVTTLRLLGPVMAFVWARAELAEAYSSDIATFLLISYYALTGVGTILVGRARAIGALRQTGLVLSLYAAFKVVMEASDLDQVGFRVGSYLVVGIFLLGVGYLYRARVPDVVSEA